MNRQMQVNEKWIYHRVVNLFGLTVVSSIVALAPVTTAGMRDLPAPPF